MALSIEFTVTGEPERIIENHREETLTSTTRHRQSSVQRNGTGRDNR
jgi:hypothetical protein